MPKTQRSGSIVGRLGLIALASIAAVLTITSFAVITAPLAQAACSALPTGKGTVAMNLSVPSSGSYRVWARMLAPSASVNGFYLQIADANACQVTMADAVIPTNTWTWVDYQNGSTASKVNVTLTAGTHQVNLAGLDDGVQIDKVLLLSDTTCTPTGDGANCINAATGSTPTPTATPGGGGGSSTPTPTPITIPVGTSSGSSGSKQPTTVSNTITIPVPAGLDNAKCSIDGKTVACSLVDTKSLSDGNHIVTVTGTDKDGKAVEQSTTIKVKNKATAGEQLIAGMKKYRWPLLAVVVVLIGAPLTWLLGRRFGLFSRFHIGAGAPGASVMPSAFGGSAPPPPPATPPGNVVYPAGPDDPSKPL